MDLPELDKAGSSNGLSVTRFTERSFEVFLAFHSGRHQIDAESITSEAIVITLRDSFLSELRYSMNLGRSQRRGMQKLRAVRGKQFFIDALDRV